MSKGLCYLHDAARPPIIHRDIKSSNILLGKGSGEKLHVVVADFGLAAIGERVLGTGHDHIVMTSHIGGTFGYMSPEYMLRGELSEKNDVYSYGVLVLELLTGRKVVAPAPSGLGWQTLVEWVKPFLRGAVVQSGSMEMPYPILDRCLWDQVAGDSIKKMVMNTFGLAWEYVQEEYGSRPAMREILQRIHNMFLEVGWDGLTVMMGDLENDVDDGAEPPHDVSGENDCTFRAASISTRRAGPIRGDGIPRYHNELVIWEEKTEGREISTDDNKAGRYEVLHVVRSRAIGAPWIVGYSTVKLPGEQSVLG
ncbi:hypothetical protein CBR_g50987 [Chara braunii]|uniref:Protein kinase domain-containing protein n=1 Tax=Chara braunii TaxID=69332 RepID=A0A388M7V2_CHABU|nr:hypothetical protein CBR_g50987 [Chara braunii]|eukprot:GBG90641.1 hypothetical protein CBR_g50987 [Chara braunii]